MRTPAQTALYMVSSYGSIRKAQMFAAEHYASARDDRRGPAVTYWLKVISHLDVMKRDQ